MDPAKGQVVLAGDPEQLGPTCISKIAEEWGLGQSLLQRLVKQWPYLRDPQDFPENQRLRSSIHHEIMHQLQIDPGDIRFTQSTFLQFRINPNGFGDG